MDSETSRASRGTVAGRMGAAIIGAGTAAGIGADAGSGGGAGADTGSGTSQAGNPLKPPYRTPAARGRV